MMRKQVFYFNFLTNPQAFEKTLTQDGDIGLTKLTHDMPDTEIDAVLQRAHGYQIRVIGAMCRTIIVVMLP